MQSKLFTVWLHKSLCLPIPRLHKGNFKKIFRNEYMAANVSGEKGWSIGEAYK